MIRGLTSAALVTGKARFHQNPLTDVDIGQTCTEVLDIKGSSGLPNACH